MNVYLITFLVVIAALLAFNNKKKDVKIKQMYPDVNLANTFVDKDITQALFNELKDISKKLSNCNNLNLKGKCKEHRYIPATTDENLVMDLDNISKLITANINSETNNFRFIKTEYDNIIEKVDKHGNKHYIYDLLAFDVINYYKIRFKVNVIQYVLNHKKNKYLTCTELTNAPFKNYPIGIPQKNQLIPLPTEVITTSCEVLDAKGVDFHVPPITKSLFINSIKVVNSSLVVKSGKDCFLHKVGGTMDTSLENHNVKSDNTPFIEPSKVRNKWPTLSTQPINQGPWPSTQVPFTWNNKGVVNPMPKQGKACPGYTHALNVPELNAEYWPNNIRVPRNSGENYWLFDLSRGITSFPTGSATGSAN